MATSKTNETATIVTDKTKNKVQDGNPVYRLKMVFSLDVSDPLINKMTEMIDGSHPVLMNAVKCTLELTRPGIPTTDELRDYEKAIKETYTTDRMRVDHVRFKHYASVTAV